MYGKRPKNIPIIGKILKMKNIAHNSSMSIKKRGATYGCENN